ncbi:hypothetical protein NW768_011819 [Fusarium equiseti]|uniref:Conidial development protein fluffy n=1 Tax=Fusarium equiseti TaxID=61235 RepID=A0ABQ8QWI2_FUSEQ|nr:hypothetical protein NW768_011819 [Fusarium equiseti]
MALKRQVDEFQQTLSEHAEIIEHLRSVPEPEAISTIRRLRTTPNASMVLSSLRGAAHTTARPSEIRTSRAILPPTEFELEFELTMRHNTVYRNLIPLDLDSIDIDKLTSFSPRQLSPVLAPPGTGHLIEASSSTTNVTILPPSALRGVRSRNISPVAGPEPDRQHCDSRLNQLKIGYWTCVPISDEFAACVLSHYLESDHPIYAAIDADLFLSDLADRTFDHCSPFLVSALMSFACQSYTQFDKRASALSAAFIDEAQRLWQAEQPSQTPNQVAGLVYLALATGISGRDELGIFYAAECRKLAEVMNLFGVQPTETLVSTFHCLSPDKIKSLAFAAWGAFAWLGPFRLIAQANLAAALECGALDSDTASVMMEEISNVGKHHVAADEAVISGLLDFDLATKTLQEAQIVAVAKRFDELILFGELTTGCLDSTTDMTY